MDPVERDPLPSGAFFGGVPFRQFSGPEIDAEQAEIANEVAVCMVREGFDFTPPPVRPPVEEPELEVEWAGPEFIVRYGYGIVTQPYGYLSQFPSERDLEDPNADYVAGMSPAEASAYYVALYGEDLRAVGFTQETLATRGWFPEDGGCSGAAAREVVGQWPDTNAAAWLPLFLDHAAAQDAAWHDPRRVAAQAEWAACMERKGYLGLQAFEDATLPFRQLVEEARTAAWDLYWSMQDGEAVYDRAAIDRELARRYEELADQYADQEIATAIADRNCLVEVGYDDVTYEHDLQFVETHRTELELWVQAHEGR